MWLILALGTKISVLQIEDRNKIKPVLCCSDRENILKTRCECCVEQCPIATVPVCALYLKILLI